MPRSAGSTQALGATVAQPLSESASLFLDVIRFAAALAVVADHLSLPEFHSGFPNREIFGYIAVPVFFVLSGFVIRFVTLTRETTLREYLIDRASRIYSVVLPALLLTLVLGGVSVLVNPLWFHPLYDGLFSHPLTRIALNVTFLSQAWGLHTIPFINIPFWSMGYECPFYVLYAFAFFLRGIKRLLACIAVALLSGPQVLFLFPIWLLGCLVFEVFMRIRHTRAASVLLAFAFLWLAAGIGLAAAGRPALLLSPFSAVQAVSLLPNPLELLHQPIERSTMFSVGIGVLSSIALLVLLLAADLVPLLRSGVWPVRVRRVADGTFTIYLMHFPLIVTAAALHLFRPDRLAVNYAVTAAIVLLLIWLAGPIDDLKRLLRNRLRIAFPQPAERKAS